MSVVDKFLTRINAPAPVLRMIQIAQIVIGDMQRCDLFKHASAMAYVTLFSLVPSLAAVFGFARPFLGPDSVVFKKVTEYVLEHLTTGTGEQVITYLENFINNMNVATLGVTGFVGIFVTLTLLLRQIEIALNRIFLVKKSRNLVMRIVYFLGFLFVGMMIAGAGFFVLYNKFNALQDSIPSQASGLAKLMPLISTWAVFTFTYKVVPNTFVPFKQAAAGALISAVLFQLASRGYGWYAANFNSYQAFYGALAAIPLFLMWLYIIWLVTLVGAVFSWRFQQGFEVADDMDDDNLALTASEKLRNHRLQTAVPVLVILAVVDEFRRGAGKGITGYDIAQKLNIPMPWVEEAVEAMIDLGYLVLAAEGYESASDPMQARLFPAVPPEKVRLRDFYSGLNKQAQVWLEEWQHQWPLDLKKVIADLWKKIETATPEASLIEVLEKLPKPRKAPSS